MTVFFGLDGEMSAASYQEGGRLIQIGLAAHTNPDGTINPTPDTFSHLINPGVNHWEPRAEAVHGFTRLDIAHATPAAQVDDLAVTWLLDHGADLRHRHAISIGYNVGAFDLPHVALVLPKTAALFSRRSIDLNAICFTLEGLEYEGTSPKWSGWKRLASLYAERTINDTATQLGTVAHDAGYDALLHLHAWRFLQAAVQGRPLQLPQEPVQHHPAHKLIGTLLAAVGIVRATELTGYTPETLKGWSNGGRITDPDAETTLRAALETAKATDPAV